MQSHLLQPKTKRQTKKIVGRGSKRGKTSGRGMKGQKARAGNSVRPAIRDIISKIPKLRGHGKNRSRTVNTSKQVPQVVTLKTLNDLFKDKQVVNPKALVGLGAVKRYNGYLPKVKVVATGNIEKALIIENCLFTDASKQKIEKAGGKVS